MREDTPAIGEVKPKVATSRIFGNYENYFKFCIAWQRATGEILKCYQRTEEQGEEKLEDARIREMELKMLKEQGLI